MNVTEILTPIIQDEFEKRGQTADTVHLNGAIRAATIKKIKYSIIFGILGLYCLSLILNKGTFGVICMGLDIFMYITKMRKAKVDNIGYIIATAKSKPDTAIEEIVAEEMARV